MADFNNPDQSSYFKKDNGEPYDLKPVCHNPAMTFALFWEWLCSQLSGGIGGGTTTISQECCEKIKFRKSIAMNPGDKIVIPEGFDKAYLESVNGEFIEYTFDGVSHVNGANTGNLAQTIGGHDLVDLTLDSGVANLYVYWETYDTAFTPPNLTII